MLVIVIKIGLNLTTHNGISCVVTRETQMLLANVCYQISKYECIFRFQIIIGRRLQNVDHGWR